MKGCVDLDTVLHPTLICFPLQFFIGQMHESQMALVIVLGEIPEVAMSFFLLEYFIFKVLFGYVWKNIGETKVKGCCESFLVQMNS